MLQHAIHEPRQVRRHRLHRLARAQTPPQRAEPRSQVTVASEQRRGSHAERVRHSILRVAVFVFDELATANLPFR